MWPRRKRHGVLLAPIDDIPLAFGHVLQWDKEEYRGKVVFCEEMYVLCLSLLGLSKKEQLVTIQSYIL